MDTLELIKTYFENTRHRVYDLDAEKVFRGEYDITSMGRSITGRIGAKIIRNEEILSVSACRFQEHRMSILRFSDNIPMIYHFVNERFEAIHKNYIDIRYILKGSLTMRIEEDTVKFHEGEFLILSETAEHTEIPAESCGYVLNMSVNNTFFNSVFFDKLSSDPLQDFLRQNILFQNRKNHFIRFSCDKEEISQNMQWYIYNYTRECIDRQPGYLDICTGYLVRLFTLCSNNYQFTFSQSERELYKKYLFQSVSQYMENNLAIVSMDALVKKFSYQANFFNHLIIQHTGMTYSDYLIMLRIEYAKKLLLTTDLPIEEVIWQCGYSNKGFFYKKFRESTAVRPCISEPEAAG